MPRFNWPLDGEVDQNEDICDKLVSCLSAFEENNESDLLVSGTSSEHALSDDCITDSEGNEGMPQHGRLVSKWPDPLSASEGSRSTLRRDRVERGPHRKARKVSPKQDSPRRQQIINDRLKQRTHDIIQALRISCTSVVTAFQDQRRLLYELHGLGVRIPRIPDFPSGDIGLRQRVGEGGWIPRSVLEKVSESSIDTNDVLATADVVSRKEATPREASASVGRYSKKFLKSFGGSNGKKIDQARAQMEPTTKRSSAVNGAYDDLCNIQWQSAYPPNKATSVGSTSGHRIPTKPSLRNNSTPTKPESPTNSSPGNRTSRNVTPPRTPSTHSTITLSKVGGCSSSCSEGPPAPLHHERTSMVLSETSMAEEKFVDATPPRLSLPLSSSPSIASISTRSGGSISTCSPSSYASSHDCSSRESRVSPCSYTPLLCARRSTSSLRVHDSPSGDLSSGTSGTKDSFGRSTPNFSACHSLAKLGTQGSLSGEQSIPAARSKDRIPKASGTSKKITSNKIPAEQKDKSRSEPLPLPPVVERRRVELARQREREWRRRNSLKSSVAAQPIGACSSSVRVILRCRPLGVTSFDSPCGMMRAVRCIDGHRVEVQRPWPGATPQCFAFDSVFGEEATQEDVYASCSHIVRSVSQGARAAILAYGQTGSGKTHTMYGSEENPGLAPRAALDLLTSAPEGLQVSMLELNFDGLVDLLAPQGPKGKAPCAPVEIRKGSGSEAVVEGLRDVSVKSVSALGSVVSSGLSRRRRSAHLLNAESSRGHLVLILRPSSGGQLMVCDLAGTERVKRSGVQGSQMREAQGINRSLQCLSEVVDALRHGRSHVPYRNSTLTLLLSDVLSGYTETAAVVCVASEASNVEESMAALCFAQRVRLMRDHASSGVNSRPTTTAPAPRSAKPSRSSPKAA